MFGEERSPLSDILTAGLNESEIDLTLRVGSPAGSARTEITGGEGMAGVATLEAQIRRSPRGITRVVRLGPFGAEPVRVAVDGTVAGPSGLTSEFRAHVCNYRVVSPRAWIEQSMATSTAEWVERADRFAV